MTTRVAYRHAAYDSPWWVIPSSRAGRFSGREDDAPTQYLSLHPLGPGAELLRHQLRGPDRARADTMRINLWAVLVEDGGSVDVTFDNCASEHGIAPDELVGDDYVPTRALASRLRQAGVSGFTAPSAALPGTDNLILFGPRVLHPYLANPTTHEECPTGHLSDGARPASEVVDLVRFEGAPHSALEGWRTSGRYERLEEPPALRW